MHVQADRLGSIVMIELRNAIQIPHAELKSQWETLGLPAADLPRRKSPKDAFRKATPREKKSVGLQLEPYQSPKALQKAGFELAVVMTRVSDAKTKLSKLHRNKLVVGLDKTGRFEVVGEPHSKEEEDYLHDIRGKFIDYTQNEIIDGVTVRSAIKNASLHANAFIIKGGVFMFPEVAQETAQALVNLAGYLSEYLPTGTAPNETMIIDYLDTPLQREQLKTKLEIYIRETIEQKFLEIQTRDKAPTDRGMRGIFTELAELGVLIDTYEGVLQETLTDIRSYQLLQQAAIEAELKKF